MNPVPKSNWNNDVQTSPRCEGITDEHQADVRNKTVPTALQTFNALLMGYRVELKEACRHRLEGRPGFGKRPPPLDPIPCFFSEMSIVS